MEIQALPDLESLLGDDRSPLDPWHRLSAISEDCILLTEFSENEGPRPALCVPTSPGSHFDQDAFAVWLMTSDYQRQNYGSCDGRSHELSSVQQPLHCALNVRDAQVMLHNSEQGVFAFAQHFTLYELRARAFVRPFCLSYVCKDRRKLAYLFEELHQDFTQMLIEPLKACNKRLFFKELTEALKILDALENQTISSYYELCYTGQSSTGNDLPKHGDKADTARHSRYRRLHTDIYAAYKSLSQDADASGMPLVCVEDHKVNMDAWFRSLNRDTESKERQPLRFLSTLAPCAFCDFKKACRRTLYKYNHWSPALPYHLMTHVQPSSLVRIGSLPMLYYPTGSSVSLNNVACTMNGSNAEAVHELQGEGDGEESKMAALYSSPRLSSLLYSVLMGKFVLLIGSELRQKSVTSFVEVLKKFVPTVYSNPPVRPWNRGPLSTTALVDYKVFGMYVPKATKADQLITDNMAPLVALVDLNRDVLYAPEYGGSILRELASISRRHRCDNTFVAYLLAVISGYCSLAYVLNAFLGDRSQWKSNEPKQRLMQFASHFNLDEHDLKVTRYLVDLVQVQSDQGSSDLQSLPDMLAFDSELPKVLRL